jgi:8-oxo-dGTP pyrophosphatase MutT (NUDIX family)/phosphohistidine phosphatase SixA
VRVIRSAGGVLWRETGPGATGSVEIAVIHRERYDDWSLPKGKLDSGEHLLAAAVREVWEETGSVGVPQIRLPGSRYLTGIPGTEKTVDFWSMRALAGGAFAAGDEVDELRWVGLDTADRLLTYAHDRGVVAAFASLRPVTGTLVLVRHARAGSRKAWSGADEDRPLDPEGKPQAAVLAPLLALFRPTRVYAAPLRRCVDTVGQIGLPVRTDTVLAEKTAATPKAVADLLRSLATEHGRVVVCSQGGVIPDAIAALRPPNVSATTTFRTRKGDAWVLNFSGTDLIAADPLSLRMAPWES